MKDLMKNSRKFKDKVCDLLHIPHVKKFDDYFD